MTAGANTLAVLAGCTALGATCGAVGTFVIARRQALVADVASHATLPGACIGFLLAERLGHDGRNPWILLGGAATTALLAAWCVPALARLRRIGPDAATAIVLAGFFGLGAVLLSLVQSHASGAQGGLSRILLGSAAAMTQGDLATLGVLSAIALALLVALVKELVAVCFDAAHARMLGIPVRSVDLALLAVLVATVVAGLQVVGAVLVVALLLAPAAAARQFGGGVTRVAVTSAALGAASALGGVALSLSSARIPTGSAIALVASAVFLASVLARGGRVRRGNLESAVAGTRAGTGAAA